MPVKYNINHPIYHNYIIYLYTAHYIIYSIIRYKYIITSKYWKVVWLGYQKQRDKNN